MSEIKNIQRRNLNDLYFLKNQNQNTSYISKNDCVILSPHCKQDLTIIQKEFTRTINNEPVNKSYNLRQAKVKDAKAISRIVKSVNRLIPKNDEKAGFLVFDLGFDEYKRKIILNHDFSFVAVDDRNTVCGFILCMPKSQIETDLKNGFLNYEDQILKTAFKIAGNEDFIWGDQMAVFPYSMRNKGIGSGLLRRVFDTMHLNRIRHFFGMVALWPLKNCAGLNLLYANGFRVVCSIEIDNIRWGIVYNEV